MKSYLRNAALFIVLITPISLVTLLSVWLSFSHPLMLELLGMITLMAASSITSGLLINSLTDQP
jgi:predicted permease